VLGDGNPQHDAAAIIAPVSVSVPSCTTLLTNPYAHPPLINNVNNPDNEAQGDGGE